MHLPVIGPRLTGFLFIQIIKAFWRPTAMRPLPLSTDPGGTDNSQILRRPQPAKNTKKA